MTDRMIPGVSCRNLLAGIAGTSALLATATRADALPVGPFFGVGDGLEPAAIDPAVTGLTYATFDAAAFFPGNGTRYSDDTSGTGVSVPPNTLLAPLLLPSGSVIRQINIAYQGTPTFSVVGRPFATPQTTTSALATTLAAGGGPKTQTVSGNVVIAPDATYSLRLACAPGDSVYGITVGYQPPVQGFVPFVGTPRVFDTRNAGGKFAAGEERTVALGAPGVRGAIVNITATETEGAGGYLAVFPANISWPGNSSINWSGPGQNVANAGITAVDGNCQIIIRAGENATHVIVDRIGWLV